MSLISVEIKQLNPKAVLPKRATEGSAAYDLFLPSDYAPPPTLYNAVCEETGFITLHSGEILTIGLGYAIDLQTSDYAFIILPRSGTGSRGLHLANVAGLIDSDYQGEVILKLTNVTDSAISFNPKAAVAQGFIIPIVQAHWIPVDTFSRDTIRGERGFGHTDSLLAQVTS